MKPHFILIAFIMALSANAQSVTEKDLLGTWQVNRLSYFGVTIDFDSDTVTVDQEAADAAEMKESEIENLKNLVKDQMGDKIKNNKLIFKKGFMMESIEAGKSETGPYTLSMQDGVQYISFIEEGQEQMQFETAIQNGLLMLTAAQGITLYLKRI